MSEKKKMCIFGEALEGGYPKMLITVIGEDNVAESFGDYVMSNLEDMLAVDEPNDEPVTIAFTVRKMTQKEIDALPDL